MKYVLPGLLLLVSSAVFSQATVRDQLDKITTNEQAQAYIAAHAALKPALLNLSSKKDSTLIDKRLLKQNKGDVFSVGYVTYKVLEANEKVVYRASYIFLDGSSL